MSARDRRPFDRTAINDDTPLRLEVAASLAFPDGTISLSSLRREAAKGRLIVWRIAGKDMTTLSEINKMVMRCRVQKSPPYSGSVPPPKIEKLCGSSLTEDARLALDAARQRAQKLKTASRSTSRNKRRPAESAERRSAETPIADVLSVYLDECVPSQARPAKGAERVTRLLDWWGARMLSEVTPQTCREYVAARRKGGARRDLEDFAQPSIITPSAGCTPASSRWRCRQRATRVPSS